MSNINTNGINGNFPVPGVNNDTQGFRDNFTSIKNNLITAGTELSDLQNKVIVKSALDGTALNNDMGGTLLSNVLSRGFRASTAQIADGNIPASIVIDISKGDIQYGNIVENTTLSFGGWSPTGTQSEVQLNLTISNSQAMIRLPETFFDADSLVTTGMRISAGRIENMMTYYTGNSSYAIGYQSPANESIIPTFSIPDGVTEVQLRFTTVDCGTTIDIQPITRDQVSTRMEIKQPAAIGSIGDFPGAFCTDGANLFICIGTYDGTTHIWKRAELTSI